jgi:hypothetical protein
LKHLLELAVEALPIQWSLVGMPYSLNVLQAKKGAQCGPKHRHELGPPVRSNDSGDTKLGHPTSKQGGGADSGKDAAQEEGFRPMGA